MAAVVRVVLERLRRQGAKQLGLEEIDTQGMNETVGTVWTDAEKVQNTYNAKKRGYRNLFVFLVMFISFALTIYTQRGIEKVIDAEKPLRASLNIGESQTVPDTNAIYGWFNETILPIFENPLCGDGSCDRPFEFPAFWQYGCPADCGTVQDQYDTIFEFTTEQTLYLEDIKGTKKDSWNLCLKPFAIYGDDISVRCLHGDDGRSFGFDEFNTIVTSDGKELVWSRHYATLTNMNFRLEIDAAVSVNVTAIGENVPEDEISVYLTNPDEPYPAGSRTLFAEGRCDDAAMNDYRRRLDWQDPALAQAPQQQRDLQQTVTLTSTDVPGLDEALIIDTVLDAQRQVGIKEYTIPFRNASVDKAVDAENAREMFMWSMKMAILVHATFQANNVTMLLFGNQTLITSTGKGFSHDSSPVVRVDFSMDLYTLPGMLHPKSPFDRTYNLRNDTDVRVGIVNKFNAAVMDDDFAETMYYFVASYNATENTTFSDDDRTRALYFFTGVDFFGDDAIRHAPNGGDRDCRMGYFERYWGDGACDAELNTRACGWDDGDCCEDTCHSEEGEEGYDCGSFGFSCLDPLGECDFQSVVANGECDLEANTAACAYDGGDCCENTCIDPADGGSCAPDNYYACMDPDSEDFISCLDRMVSLQDEFWDSLAVHYSDEDLITFPSDGFCDFVANTPFCDWDGGDCCETTCNPTLNYHCDTWEGNCRDENIAPFYGYYLDSRDSDVNSSSSCRNFIGETNETCFHIHDRDHCLQAAKADGYVRDDQHYINHIVQNETLPEGCFFGAALGHSAGLYFNDLDTNLSYYLELNETGAYIPSNDYAVTLCECEINTELVGPDATMSPTVPPTPLPAEATLAPTEAPTEAPTATPDTVMTNITETRRRRTLEAAFEAYSALGIDKNYERVLRRLASSLANGTTHINEAAYVPLTFDDLTYQVEDFVEGVEHQNILIDDDWYQWLFVENNVKDFDMTQCSFVSNGLCSEALLGLDNVCQQECNIKECAYDFGNCRSSAPYVTGAECIANDTSTPYFLPGADFGCYEYMLADSICDPQCNVEQCGYDNGACCVPVDAPVTYELHIELYGDDDWIYPFPNPSEPMYRFIAGNHLLLQGVLLTSKVQKPTTSCATVTQDGNWAERLKGVGYWADEVPQRKFDEAYNIVCKSDEQDEEPRGTDPVFVTSSGLYAEFNGGTIDQNLYYDEGGDALDPVSGLPYAFNFTESRGEYDSYDGYHVFFDINYWDSWAEMIERYMEEGDFIPGSTMSEMRVSYVTYSGQLKVFALSEAIFQFEDNGEINVEHSSVDAFRVQIYDDNIDYLRYVFEIIQMITVAVQWLVELTEIFRERLSYFYTDAGFAIWNIFDLTTLVIFTIMIFSIQLTYYPVVDDYFPKLRIEVYDRINRVAEVGGNWLGHDNDKLLDVLDGIEDARWFSEYWRYYMTLGGIAFIFMIFRLIKMLHFQPTLGVVSRTIGSAWQALLSWAVVFVMIQFSFAFMGFLMFGSWIEELSTFARSLDSTFNMLTLVWIPDVQNETKMPELLALWTYAYIVVMFFILLNVLLAILVESYLEVKEEADKDQSPGQDIGMLFKNVAKDLRAKDGQLTTYEADEILNRYASMVLEEPQDETPLVHLEDAGLFVNEEQLAIMLALELDEIFGAASTMSEEGRDKMARALADYICNRHGHKASTQQRKYGDYFEAALARIPDELRGSSGADDRVIDKIIAKARSRALAAQAFDGNVRAVKIPEASATPADIEGGGHVGSAAIEETKAGEAGEGKMPEPPAAQAAAPSAYGGYASGLRRVVDVMRVSRQSSSEDSSIPRRPSGSGVARPSLEDEESKANGVEA